MAKNEHHVLCNSSRGGWDVKHNDAQRVCVHTETKAEAVKVGRVMSQRAGSVLIIHDTNGHVQHKR